MPSFFNSSIIIPPVCGPGGKGSVWGEYTGIFIVLATSRRVSNVGTNINSNPLLCTEAMFFAMVTAESPRISEYALKFRTIVPLIIFISFPLAYLLPPEKTAGRPGGITLCKEKVPVPAAQGHHQFRTPSGLASSSAGTTLSPSGEGHPLSRDCLYSC